MQKEIECFKIVINDPRNKSIFHSFCDYNSLTRLIYTMNETTYPIIGKLFVFDSIDNCKYLGTSSYTIIKGIGYNATKCKASCWEWSNIELFWKLKKQKKSTKNIKLDTRNIGAFYVDSFMPTSIIRYGSITY